MSGAELEGPVTPSPPRIRASVLAAWAAWAAALAITSLGAALGMSAAGVGSAVVELSAFSWVVAWPLSVAYATVGLFLRLRVPGNPVGWLFLLIGISAGLGSMAFGYVDASSSAPGIGPIEASTAGWLHGFVPPVWSWTTIVLLAVFPDGRLPGDRWRWLLPAATLGSLFLATVLAAAPGPLFFFPAIENPFGLADPLGPIVRAAVPVAIALELALVFAAAWSMVLRYRGAGPVERQQLKWFAFAAAIFALAGALYILLAGTSPRPTSGLSELAWLGFVAAATFIPVAASLAIIRHGLYQIDVIIGRTIVYTALTAILAGLYSALIRLSQAIFVAVTGDESDTALVITTLVLVVSFTPVKEWLERQVERRYKVEEEDDLAGLVSHPRLTRQVEEIARRVALEVLAADPHRVRGRKGGPSRGRPSRAGARPGDG